MKFGIVTFPGSNCDHDAYTVAKDVLGEQAEYIWHVTTDLESFDCIILPGGFSYGDYLRPGAIANFSPIMKAVREYSDRGGLILGVCNGFQILLESGLLPGALVRNKKMRFLGRSVYLRIEDNSTAFTNRYKHHQIINLPIAHGDGDYYNFSQNIQTLEKSGQVIFRYCTRDGELSPSANPNGSIGSIAGIVNRAGNVLGMMPHPERAAEALLGSADGLALFESIQAHIGNHQLRKTAS